MLDISKIEAGELEVQLKQFDLENSIARIFALLIPMAEGKGLKLSIQSLSRPCKIISD